MRSRCLLLFFLSALLLRAQKRDTHDFLGLGAPPDEAAAKLGEPLFKQNCATCHGEDARGAQGPNLLRSTLVLHDEKGHDIGQVVKNGRPEGGMPAFPNLTSDQIYDLAEYLHQQVENAANRGVYKSLYANQRNKSTGDVQQGKLFFNAHCASCHSATGDLSKIGDKLTGATEMQERILWPATHEPLHGTVMTASGQSFSGTILKIDDFDISLRDDGGQTHDWPRDQVQVKVEDKLAGHRALLPLYTDADLHNLAAYLLTLK